MRKMITMLLLMIMQPANADFEQPNTGVAMPADSRCSLSTGTAVIDYGTQYPSQLQNTGDIAMLTPGMQTLNLSVVCPYSQTMRLMFHGERAENANLRYGKDGNVNIRLLDAQLDGSPVQLAPVSPDGVINGDASATVIVQPGNRFAAKTHDGQLAKGRSFHARIEIEPVIAASGTRISSRQISETHLTLELMD